MNWCVLMPCAYLLNFIIFAFAREPMNWSVLMPRAYLLNFIIFAVAYSIAVCSLPTKFIGVPSFI